MGILIKGMEMPEGRGEYELLLRIDLNGTATVEGSYLRFEGEPFEAVPVPPHGRLIDADAVETGVGILINGYFLRGEREDFKRELRELIACAPTIIPSEEEVYDMYTDTAGNLHWTGTHSGKHIIPAEESE